MEKTTAVKELEQAIEAQRKAQPPAAVGADKETPSEALATRVNRDGPGNVVSCGVK